MSRPPLSSPVPGGHRAPHSLESDPVQSVTVILPHLSPEDGETVAALVAAGERFAAQGRRFTARTPRGRWSPAETDRWWDDPEDAATARAG